MVKAKKKVASDISPYMVCLLECLRVVVFVLLYRYYPASVIAVSLIGVAVSVLFFKNRVSLPLVLISLLLSILPPILFSHSDFSIFGYMLSILYDVLLAEILYARRRGIWRWAVLTPILFATPVVLLIIALVDYLKRGGCRGCVVSPGFIALLAFLAAFIIYAVAAFIRWLANYHAAEKGPGGRL